MAENIKEELIMEEIEIKEEEVFIKEEMCSSSILEGNLYLGCTGRRCSDGKSRN